MSKFTSDAYLKNGIVRWKSNDQIPFDDMLEFFLHRKEITNEQFINSTVQRAIETDTFLTEYGKQMQNHVHTDEELYEMRSAFGEGVVVSNVITGKRIRL